MRFKKNERGMTLVEIMIVLAIIASIMSVLLPTIQRNLKKSKVSETKLIMNNIIQALNQYSTDCGKIPKSLEGLVTAPGDCSNWGPEAYLKKLPKDGWKNDFVYTPKGSNYELKSFGSDGKDGGDGYDKDITQDDLD
jgi:general secretion pathway protein G